MADSRKRVVVAGGGMSGALVAKLLESQADVTLIDSKDYFEIRWAVLRALVEPSFADKIVIPHKDYLKQAQVEIGQISAVTENEVTLSDGRSVPYDVLIIATGSTPAHIKTASERLQYFQTESEKIKSAKSILIVGGGPVGVEFAGEVLTDFASDSKSLTLVHSSNRLIEFMKDKASAKALTWLQSKKVELLLGDRVENLNLDQSGTSGTFSTRSGKEFTVDYLFVAIGSWPDASWLAGSPFLSASLDANNRVKVDDFFRVEGHGNIFAIGDITNVKENKQGYVAQIHARNTAFNIIKLLKENPTFDPSKTVKGLKPYKLSPDIAFMSLGRKQGIAQLPFGTFMGFIPVNVKCKSLFVPTVRKELGLKP